MSGIANLILLAIRVLVWLIIIDAILTWIPSINRYHPLVVLLRKVTRPVVEPFRKLVPAEKTGYVDISPMLAIVFLYLLGAVVVRLAR